MPRSITRFYLRSRYWFATAALLFALALTVGFGVLYLQALQNNARYSAAFVDLTEKANDVERSLLELGLSAEDAEARASASAGLQQSTLALAEVYTGLRLSDPDADDVKGNADEGDENQLVEDLALDLAAIEQQYGLASRGMPEEMVRIWESEDDDAEADGEPGEAGQADGAEDVPLLEENVGAFLGLAMSIQARVDAGAEVPLAEIRQATEHFEKAIRPSLGQVTVAIRQSADRSAHMALLVLALGALFCAIVSLGNVFFLFAPMANDVVESQTALASERDRAVSSERAKKDFLAVMSHELRTPMNGVLGFASLVLRTDLTDEQREYIEIMKGSGESLLELLNSILDISKIEAGSMEAEPHNFSIQDTIDSAVQLLAAQAHEKRLEITNFVDAGLPSEMYGDSGLIRKLVLNLVGNAVKFTAEGGVAIEVRSAEHTEAEVEDGALMLAITVTDTGVGIPPEKHALIFDRFSQADASTEREFEGTGLGLAICREIAQLMGGRIWVESEPGVGSSFHVVLRLQNVSPQAPTLRDSSGCDLTGARILIVDDNALNRRIATLQVEAYGARPDSVESAEAALAALAQAASEGTPYTVCIIDQMMPGTDGVSLLRMIRANENYGSLKTVLSSSAGVRTDKDARQLGFDAAVPKPVRQDQMIGALAALQSAGMQDPREAELDQMLEEAEEKVRPAAIGENPHLLVVEDNAANLKLACLILTEAGYSVDTAANGVEAVTAATQFAYHAILMDIRMPVMDGLEATRRIRQLGDARAAVPIIAMTADVAEFRAEEFEAAGMETVISKPIDEQKVLTTIKAVLQSRADTAA